MAITVVNRSIGVASQSFTVGDRSLYRRGRIEVVNRFRITVANCWGRIAVAAFTVGIGSKWLTDFGSQSLTVGVVYRLVGSQSLT